MKRIFIAGISLRKKRAKSVVVPQKSFIYEWWGSLPGPTITCGKVFYTYYMRRCKAIKLSVRLGSVVK